VYRVRQFLRLCWHTRIMGRQQQRRGTVGGNQHWQKGSSYIEKDCFEKSQTYCSIGGSRTEYSSRRLCFYKNFLMWASKIYSRLQLLNLSLLILLLRCVNDGVTTMKPGHQTTANARVIWSDESPFTLFPTSGRVYDWRTPKETCNPEFLVPTVKHGEGSVMVWAAISWYCILLAPLLPFTAELLQGST
jgi:hypothetical protein